MKKSRRVYVGILGVALGAMAIDMLVLRTEPGAASADQPIGLAPEVATGQASGKSNGEPTLAEVIGSLATTEPSARELFSVPEAWLPSEIEAVAGPLGTPMPRLTLTNTLADVAQINSRTVRVGSFVDRERTVRLVRIENVGMRLEGMGEAPSAIVEFSGVLYRIRAGSEEPELVKATGRADSAG